jgi:hypothetical protein
MAYRSCADHASIGEGLRRRAAYSVLGAEVIGVIEIAQLSG